MLPRVFRLIPKGDHPSPTRRSSIGSSNQDGTVEDGNVVNSFGSSHSHPLITPQTQFLTRRSKKSVRNHAMPQAIPEVDKEKVKFVALQVGVREAARAFDIPEGTV